MATRIHPAASRKGRRLPPFSQVVKRRTEALFLAFGLAYAVLGLRLSYIQVVRHGWYAEKAQKWHTLRIPLLARRGAIYTRDGQELASTIQCASVFANPSQIPVDHREAVARALATTLNQPVESIAAKINAPKKFVWLAREIMLPTAYKIRDMKLLGIGIKDDETKREYPNDSLASNLLGFVNIDGHGMEGVERVFDRQLGGRDGYATAQVDARRKVIAETRQVGEAARDGHPITLSIDYGLQSAVEKELDKNAETYHPAGQTCTVMDVRTGEILAMASYPRFDPNHPASADPNHRRNRPVTDTYEPGSTLKTLTMAAGLDCGAITMESTFHCAGQERIGNKTIHCVVHPPFHGGHGTVHPLEIIEHSCNIGAAHVGLAMGANRLKDYMERFGLNRKTGIELTGEESGIFPDPKKQWAVIRTANVAFGQGISVTPLQLLTAYAAVANGGRLLQPTILKRTGPAPGKQIIQPLAAGDVRALLKGCVTNGTGKPAKIRGYAVGGKTGSAQKAVPGLGYRNNKIIASFASVLPINDPKIAILVTVDEPQGTKWGAVAAAPVVREVARQAVIELGIPPSDPNDVVDGSDRRTWKKEKRA